MSKVRLLHWNISYEERPENAIKLVREIKPDILCCQEVNDANENLVQRMAKLFSDHYFEPAEIIGAGGDRFRLGNAIFSNYSLSNDRKVLLQKGPNQTSRNRYEERVYIEAVAQINNKQLTIGTTHLSFAPHFESTPDRQGQARKLLAAIKNNSRNFIITGDFNAAPQTKIIKDLEKIVVSAGPPHNEPTFTTAPFTFLGFTVSGLDWRVDYIFASRDMKIFNSEIIDTRYSDHLPILAVFDI